MGKTKLTLLNKNANGVWQLVVEYSADGQRRFDTSIRITSDQFDRRARQVCGPGAKEMNRKANELLDIIKGQVRHLFLQNGGFDPTVHQLDQYRTMLVLTATEKPIQQQTLCQILSEWVKSKADWQPSTIRNFGSLVSNIQDYERANKTIWYLSTLTTKDVNTWQNWLKNTKQGKEQCGYADSTLHKRVRLLRQFLKKHKAPHVDLDDDDAKALHQLMLVTPATLTQDELEALDGLDLATNPRLDRVRDLAILQAFCGLRISDLKRVESRFIQKNHISIFMVKSGSSATWVHIPIFAHSARILRKYTKDGKLELPPITDQKFNDYFKELCQLVPSLLDNYTQDYRIHGELKLRKKPKWEYLSSHSLRKTFVSTCLDLGFAAREVMEWSGHKTWAAFQRYVGSAGQRPGAASEFAARWEENRQQRSIKEGEYTLSMLPQLTAA